MDFELGYLYVRQIDGKATVLFYPLTEVPKNYDSFPCQRLLDLQNGVVADFSDAVELVQDGETVGEGSTVTFKKVEDSDLVAILYQWSDEKTGIERWAEVVRGECTTLSEIEQDRIRRVIKAL